MRTHAVSRFHSFSLTPQSALKVRYRLQIHNESVRSCHPRCHRCCGRAHCQRRGVHAHRSDYAARDDGGYHLRLGLGLLVHVADCALRLGQGSDVQKHVLPDAARGDRGSEPWRLHDRHDLALHGSDRSHRGLLHGELLDLRVGLCRVCCLHVHVDLGLDGFVYGLCVCRQHRFLSQYF